MSRPFFTALIDTHNHERFIDEAIQSVLAQDYPQNDIEILVVDDGSTDSTPARVKAFGERIRYLYKENGGQGSALEAGLRAAQGEYVAMLDGDDVWHPAKLRLVAEAVAKNPGVVLIYHPYEMWEMSLNRKTKDPNFKPVCGNVPADRKKMLTFGNLGTTGMVLHRMAAQRLLPVPANLKILADGYLGYLAIFLGPVVGIPQHLAQYRVHGDNLCNFQSGEQARLESRARSSAAVSDGVKQWLAKNGYDLADPLIAAYVRRHELVAERIAFTSRTPGRVQFFRHLRALNSLYGELWTTRYRLFRNALSVMGFVLGYHGFRWMEELYRRAGFVDTRERLAAAQASAASHAGAKMSEAGTR